MQYREQQHARIARADTARMRQEKKHERDTSGRSRLTRISNGIATIFNAEALSNVAA